MVSFLCDQIILDIISMKKYLFECFFQLYGETMRQKIKREWWQVDACHGFYIQF